MLARLLGRLISDPESTGPRLGRGPNESLLMPELLNLGIWAPLLTLLLNAWPRGVVSSGVSLLVVEDETDDTPRLRRTLPLLMTEPRGEARGGLVVGAGNFERTDCTRASRRCIWAVRVRM